eukprot:11112460-Ditylum_brightwellii.AAC.1
MLMTINAIAAQQTHPTELAAECMTHLLNYCASHPDNVLQYHASDMTLHIHSDASYLCETRARSCVRGHFYLSKKPDDLSKPPTTSVLHNDPINSVLKILCNVMASSAEAEVGALYINACKGGELRMAFQEMGHPQPPIPIITNNFTAEGIINCKVKQRRMHTIDM